MATQASETYVSPPRRVGDEWQEGSVFRRVRELEPSEGISGWLVGGLALVGLGALAWYYLGPDIRRYLKIRSM